MMVAVACFCDQYEIDRQTVLTTLMVTTSYEEAVQARAAFFVLAKRCGRYVTYLITGAFLFWEHYYRNLYR